MRTYILIILQFLTVYVLAQTAPEPTVEIMGPVQDYVTHNVIEDVKFTLLRTDSTVIDSCRNNYGYREFRKLYSFGNLTVGKYILKAEKEGYETLYDNVEIKKIHRRETYIIRDVIYMRRPQVHMLEGVEVVATKVKFYNKGDTIVYNADAFQLSEGSMLDALVAQLPGAELKSDGRIYVNGRFVESLMLNGKDFFKGRNNILLTNLPTYAVKDIKVYEKAGDMSEFMGRDMKDKSFVMDVNLKKQYRIGWMGNVDAGAATHDLYMARLFAMRNTDHSNVALFGNINNLNDFSTPQRGRDWTPDKMPYGRLKTKTAGVNVNVDDRDNRFKFDGNANITHYDNQQTAYTNQTNFLSTGDTYGRTTAYNKFDNLYVNSNEKLRLTPKGIGNGAIITINHSLNYSRRKTDVDVLSATATDAWEDFNDFTAQLSQPILNDELRKKLINRYIEKSKSASNELGTNLGAEVSLKLRHSNDLLTIGANGGYINNTSEMFKRKKTDFMTQGNESTDFRNQYGDGNPNNKGYNANAELRYLPRFGKFHFLFAYNYSKSYYRSQYDLYNLDQISGWDNENGGFGILPSMADYLATRDITNSYASKRYYDGHRETVLLMWNAINNDNHNMEIRPQLSLVTHVDRLKYVRSTVDADKSRTINFLEPEFEIIWRTNDGNKQVADLYYAMTSSAPSMMQELRYVDDADPLNIYMYGNTKLKNSQYHRLDLTYINRRGRVTFAPGLFYHMNRNRVAMAFVYDPKTGRRTYSPMNVNGNWDIQAKFDMNGALDKKKSIYFTYNTQWQYINSVDMIGTEVNTTPIKSTVKTSVLSQYAYINRMFGKHSISLTGNFAWINSTSDRDDFTTINAYNFNYGVNTYWALPWKFELESDFTVYSRRGYEDNSMNDNNLVLNARLTRPILKGKIVLKVDAFDIFHQLKKVDRIINSQGRTERYYNSMPQFVLFHAIYRFDVLPKNKKTAK